MVLLKQLRKLSNQHLDLEQDVLSGLKMKMRLFVPWTGICQLEHTHFILMMVIVHSLLSCRTRFLTLWITRNNIHILDRYMGVGMFLCFVMETRKFHGYNIEHRPQNYVAFVVLSCTKKKTMLFMNEINLTAWTVDRKINSIRPVH